MNQINRYQIKAVLGGGGMALVYRAYDPRFKREVAIKVMATHLLHDPQFRQRFEREAQVIASLQHPAIVPVYDFGEQNGQLYLVMGLMSGGSLARRLQGGGVSLSLVVWLLERLAPALDMAHQKGVVHRDLKPDNILFDGQGNPYLADFGIAKLLQTTTMRLSQSGLVIGTPFYISPEQALGSKQIDGRSDIYSLGVIVFQMLTGQPPYDADTPLGLAYKHIHEPVPNILAYQPNLPAACQAVMGRVLAKNPAERYATAAQFAQALQAAFEGRAAPRAISQPNLPSTVQAVQPLTSQRLFRGLVGTVVLLMLLTVIVLLAIASGFGTNTSTPTMVADEGGIPLAEAVQATATPDEPLSPTSTPVSIDTVVAPTFTNTPVTPTHSNIPTEIPMLPTVTLVSASIPIPPTLTLAPASTAVPPTSTPVPPTAILVPTFTPIPPTFTLVPPTATLAPTSTPLPPPTSTPLPPPTSTPLPPPTNTLPPPPEIDMESPEMQELTPFNWASIPSQDMLFKWSYRETLPPSYTFALGMLYKKDVFYPSCQVVASGNGIWQCYVPSPPGGYGLYYWWVEIVKDGVLSYRTHSPTKHVHWNPPPEQAPDIPLPVPYEPVDGASISSESIEFTWTYPGDLPDKYYFRAVMQRESDIFYFYPCYFIDGFWRVETDFYPHYDRSGTYTWWVELETNGAPTGMRSEKRTLYWNWP